MQQLAHWMLVVFSNTLLILMEGAPLKVETEDESFLPLSDEAKCRLITLDFLVLSVLNHGRRAYSLR